MTQRIVDESSLYGYSDGYAPAEQMEGEGTDERSDFYALGATLYGDLNVIAFLFAAFAFMGFADAFIYARGGHPISKHVTAGIAASIVAVVACLAQTSNGAA